MPDLDARRRGALAEALHEVMCCTDPEPEAVETFKQDADALAPLIAGWLAEAWDEGHQRVCGIPDRLCGIHGNPYRADRIGGGDE